MFQSFRNNHLTGLIISVFISLVAFVPHAEASNVLPAVKLQKLTNSKGSLNTQTLRGRFAVIQFWASWCVGCSDVMVAMDNIVAKKSRTRFITVSVDENVATAQSYFNDKPRNVKKLRAVAYLDANTILAEALAVEALPAVVVVSPNGKVLQRFSGHPSKDMIQQINRLLK